MISKIRVFDLQDTREWTFNGASTRELSHCFHDYPARMIPQIASKLLDLFGQTAKSLFDPYCGTGTSLVEAKIRGINSVGTDLNPLARLIAKAKTTVIEVDRLDGSMEDFAEHVFQWKFGNEGSIPVIPQFSNIDFWFSPEVVKKLAQIKQFISHQQDDDIRDFFLVAFSETVRESSYTRNGEFKLFRMEDEKMSRFDPDVYTIMGKKLERNRNGMVALANAVSRCTRIATTSVMAFNTVEGIPSKLRPANFDLVITSPPYGDSRTTVAYGQYSRLSSQWMDFLDAAAVDKQLMGGAPSIEVPTFACKRLDEAIDSISRVDAKRTLDVASFYMDLEKSISNVARKVKRGGYACYVVGNRRVKGVTLPTDDAIVSFFSRNSFDHVKTFVRAIPNKRMPSRNSPTNVPGALDTTMVNEFIVVMRKV